MNEDGTVDVYLNPTPAEDGAGAVLAVRGVEPWDGLEDDIRARFTDWCESGDKIYL